MANYLEQIDKLVTASSAASPGTPPENLESLLQKQMADRQEIDGYTNYMQPLGATDAGVFALQDLLANQEAPKAQRAAAAQVLNPGMMAGIGANGELSFSAKPGADNGVNYPNNTNKSGQSAAQRQAPESFKFDETFRSIQGMTDPVQIANAYASASASATQWADSRKAAITASLSNSLGLTALQEQAKTDKLLDQDYYNKYYGGVNQGPTDESLRTISLLGQKQREVEDAVNKKLAADPQAIQMSTQLKILGSMVDAKLQKEFSGAEEAKNATASLIPSENIDATLIALGKKPAEATALERQTIAIGITSGNKVYTEAQAIGMAAPAQAAAIAFSSTGPQAAQALKVLESKFSPGSTVPAQIKEAYTTFDQNILPTLTSEQKEQLKVPATAISEKDKASAKSQIGQMKMQIVLDNLAQRRTMAFESSVSQWDAPQDPVIADEVQAIRKDLQSVESKQGRPIRIDELINRVDFSTQRAAKVNALTAYIQSQAKNLQDNDFFGAPAQYANEINAKAFVQTLAIKNITGISTTPSGNLLPSMGSDIYGRDRAFRQRQIDEAKTSLGE